MSAHTPGPWHVTDDGNVDSAFGGVATLLGIECPDDETRPNAILIAAAPDLLATLEEIRDMGVERADLIVAQDGPAEEVIRWRDLEPLLAVIAKAGGAA